VAVVAVLVLGLGVVGARGVFGGGGDTPYRIDSAIAEPTRENRVMPDRAQCPKDGRLADGQEAPLPKTNFTSSGSRPLDGLFAPGQLVAFEFLVEANGSAPSTGSLDFEVSWPKGSDRDAGFDEDSKVVCAFVDPTDPSASEKDESSKPAAHFTDLPPTQDSLRASFAVQNLAANDRVVVEVWLVAVRSVPTSGGLLETRISNAKADAGKKVELQRNVLNYRMNFFDRQEDPAVTMDVDDSQPADASRGDHVDYAITIANPAQTAITPAARLDAFLDPHTKLTPTLQVTDTQGSITTCAPAADQQGLGFTCNLGFLNPQESVKILARVAIQPDAERRWTKEDPGCGGEGVLTDICGRFVLSYKQGPANDARVEVDQPSDLPNNQPLTLSKLVPIAPYAYPGQQVTFTYRVSNAGQSGSFNQLRVTDDTCKDITGPGPDPNGNGKLDPGESWDYTCSIEHINADQTRSTSRADAFTDDGRPVQATAITEITLIKPKLAVSIGQASRDSPTSRPITVTGSGDAPLTDVALSAPGCASTALVASGNGDRTLDAGESWTYNCTLDPKADPKAQLTVRVYGADQLGAGITAAATG
jgi:hypothetical protein